MRILLTGGSGYLGSLLRLSLQDKYQFISLSSKDLDLSNPQQIQAFLDPLDFDVCLHLAAMTQTLYCEQNPEYTDKINTEAAIEIAKACQAKKARLVFYSTEQIFNAAVGAPFSETTPPKSSTRYGQQKIAAEAYIQANVSDYLILRLSWIFGLASPGIRASPNIIKNVMNAVFHDNPTKFAIHEHRGMTYAGNLVTNFDKMLSCQSGILHFSSDNDLTTYESAVYIAQKLGITNSKIASLILMDKEKYKDAPRDYRLNSDKARAAGFKLTTFQDDVKTCLTDFDFYKNLK